jgi:hypothetical protein
MAQISIVIEAGKIQKIDGIPNDLYLIIRNYDVDGLPESMLIKDEDGRVCRVCVWYASE